MVGLPLRRGLLAKHKFKKPKPELIYITCGKQGSHVINQAVFPIISQLVEKYKVIHQTGSHTISADQERARRVKASLPKSIRHRYKHQPYFFGKEAIRFLKTAKLVVSRAGAHTTYELMMLNKRSVVIPIPWVSHNEQRQNAELLSQSAPTVILEENELSPESLHQAIKDCLKLPAKKGKPVISDATERMVKELRPLLK